MLKKYHECRESEDFTFFDKLKMPVGKQVFIDWNGNQVGLELDNDGTGRIDIDGDYNTTYCLHLEDCNEKELQLIINDDSLYSEDAMKLFEDKFEIYE